MIPPFNRFNVPATVTWSMLTEEVTFTVCVARMLMPAEAEEGEISAFIHVTPPLLEDSQVLAFAQSPLAFDRKRSVANVVELPLVVWLPEVDL